MKILRALLTSVTLVFAAAWTMAAAQSVNAPRAAPTDIAIVPESAQAIDPAAASGPTIYVVDSNGRLATINLGTYAVHLIGYAGTQLTDIGFNPKNHQLYGVSFSAFWSVNKTTGRATVIGGLGVNDANALVFNSLGVPYSAGVNSGELYKINLSTGRASVIGRMGGYSSAGDLVFYNGKLVLTGFKGCCNVGPTTPNYLVALNENTGAVVGAPVLLGSKEIFGLVSTGANALFGLGIAAGTTTTPALYKFVPTNPVGKRDILLKNLKSSGLGQIYGAAYDGNYQP
jgi:hypothetical protein